MKDTLSLWLEQNARISGVLACAACFPIRRRAVFSYSEQYPRGTLESVWRCLADTFEVAALAPYRRAALEMGFLKTRKSIAQEGVTAFSWP